MILDGVLGLLERLLKSLLPLVLAYRQGHASAREKATEKALDYHREADRIDARSMSVRDALDELRRRSGP